MIQPISCLSCSTTTSIGHSKKWYVQMTKPMKPITCRLNELIALSETSSVSVSQKDRAPIIPATQHGQKAMMSCTYILQNMAKFAQNGVCPVQVLMISTVCENSRPTFLIVNPANVICTWVSKLVMQGSIAIVVYPYPSCVSLPKLFFSQVLQHKLHTMWGNRTAI